MRVTTASGAVYEFRPGQVRRVNTDDPKRADGEWVHLITMYPEHPKVGLSMLLITEPLGKYGADDYGNTVATGFTERSTTVVREVEP